jgi:uncharacterized glyoxalase superfamily protein PhnB
MPPGVIIPELAYADVPAAAEWLCRTFGFTERLRIGAHRIQLAFGQASVVVTELPAERRAQGPAADDDHGVLVRVDDVDRHCEHARRCGARIVRPPADHPYGERQYTAEDPDQHRWTFSQTIADVDPADWGGELIV